MSAVPPLISRIPDRRQTTYSTVLQDGSMASNFHSPTSLYAENDILVPPRPAFYGSPKPPNRSLSSDHPLPSNALYGHHHPPSSSLISSPNHQHPPTQPHHSSRQSFYTHQFSNRSVSSIHSVPSIPVVRIQPSDPTSDRRRSSTTTKPNKTTVARDQRQLDQWHSDDDDDDEVEEEDEDEDDDNDHKGAQRKHAKTSSLGSSLRPPSTANLHVPKSSTPHPTRDAVQPSHSILKPTTKIARRKPTNCQPRETDEDNVPLSMLIKKKSASSLKDLSNLASATTPISAAQTLTKGRQRLNKSNNGFIVPPLPANWPPSFAQPRPGFEPSHSRRTSAVTISGLSTDSARRASKTSIGHVPGVTVRGVDGQSVLRPILHPRGNSPASSSSRSGSGTWSIPITPHDSIGSMTQLLPPSVYYQDPQSIRASISSFGPPKSEADSVIGGRTASLKSFSAIQGPEATSPINHDLGMNGTGLWGGVRIEDLGVPAGVDPYLYSALGAEQKIQLHQRSQLMMQMMAAQTQAAIQMHAMALSKSQKAQQPLMNQQASGAQMNPVDPTGGNLYGWGTLPPMPLLDPSMLMNNPNNPHQLAMMTPSMMNVSPHQTPRPQPQPNPSLIPAIKPKESKNESELMKPFDRAPSTLSLPTPIPMGGGAHDDESKSNGGLETKE